MLKLRHVVYALILVNGSTIYAKENAASAVPGATVPAPAVTASPVALPSATPTSTAPQFIPVPETTPTPVPTPALDTTPVTLTCGLCGLEFASPHHMEDARSQWSLEHRIAHQTYEVFLRMENRAEERKNQVQEAIRKLEAQNSTPSLRK